jgi:hypothetical protein
MRAYVAEKNRINRLMKAAGIRPKQKRKFRPTTTISDPTHNGRIAPNHLAKFHTPDKPDQARSSPIKPDQARSSPIKPDQARSSPIKPGNQTSLTSRPKKAGSIWQASSILALVKSSVTPLEMISPQTWFSKPSTEPANIANQSAAFFITVIEAANTPVMSFKNGLQKQA